MMPTARTRANRKYNEKAYDRISVTVPKGRKAEIEAFAKANGESVNGIINRLLMREMGITDDAWTKEGPGE